MSITIEVRSRVIGRDESGLAPVSVDLLHERTTVQNLIERAVYEQVNELVARRKVTVERARAALDRQYLTMEEVRTQAELGAIRCPSRRSTSPPSIDPEVEAQKALSAFEAGAYFVLVDGRQVDRLDDKIELAPGIAVTFLRLMPLVGG